METLLKSQDTNPKIQNIYLGSGFNLFWVVEHEKNRFANTNKLQSAERKVFVFWERKNQGEKNISVNLILKISWICSLWHRFDSKLFRAIQQINLKMDETVAYFKNKPESGLYSPVKGPVQLLSSETAVRIESADY